MIHVAALLPISGSTLNCYPVKNMADAIHAGQYVPVQIGSYPLPNIVFENPHGRELMLLFPDSKNACPVEVFKA